MSQATFGDFDSTEPEQTTDAIPRELTKASDVEPGDLVSLDRLNHDTEQLYTVRSVGRSITIEREATDHEITLKRARGSWYHGESAITHDAYLVATDDAPVIECAECGQSIDPADVGRRVDYRYVCRGCDR